MAKDGPKMVCPAFVFSNTPSENEVERIFKFLESFENQDKKPLEGEAGLLGSQTGKRSREVNAQATKKDSDRDDFI